MGSRQSRAVAEQYDVVVLAIRVHRPTHQGEGQLLCFNHPRSDDAIWLLMSCMMQGFSSYVMAVVAGTVGFDFSFLFSIALCFFFALFFRKRAKTMWKRSTTILALFSSLQSHPEFWLF